MPGARDIDNLHSLAQLIPQRVSVSGRGDDVIETLNHQERGVAAGPPFVPWHSLAGRQVRNVNLRPALDWREDARIGGGDSQRAPSATHSGPVSLVGGASRNEEPNGVEGPIKPPAATRMTPRTIAGWLAAKQRAMRLPKA